MKIETLTPEQESLFPEYVKKWVDIGLSCEPLDLGKAKVAVIMAYKAANLKPPVHFYVFDSPVSCAIGQSILKDTASVGASVGASVWASVGNSVSDSVGTWDSVRNSVWASVWDSVSDSVGYSVWASVGAIAWDDAGWLSFYDYFLNATNLDCVKPLEGLIELSKSCGWWAPYENAVFLQHRHSILNLDAEGRLHCETGKAIEYRDGWGFSAWHGITIPDEWLTNPPKPADAIRWENIEQRRAAIEIIGWEEILALLNTKVINTNNNPQIGQLLEADLPDSGPERFLRVTCGTSRKFVIPVPKHMETAQEANLWTYGLEDRKEHLPEVRT